jgi:xanthine dehydrogenase accessory factor
VDSVDLEVLTAATQWSAAGHLTLLGTVVQTWGSAPRPPGSLIAIRGDGQVKGSVSGGCIEDDLIDQVRTGALRPLTPLTLTYGISADEAHRFGLPCGGTLRIVMEPVSEQSQLQPLLDAVLDYRLVTRELDLATGAASLRAGLHALQPVCDGATLLTSHGPRRRLVIIGAAQASRYLASMAQALDYRVIVCDPRSEYLDQWDVPGVELSREMPDDLILRLALDAHSAVVALTHDPKLDDMALLEALKSAAFYVGALGSRLNSERRRERLALFDLSAAEIARLHGPVGLDLGARTPPEIAIAILAEMTAIKNGVTIPPSRRAALPADTAAVAATLGEVAKLRKSAP